MSVFKLYAGEEVIGMDHPLFMAKTQAGIDAGLAAATGVPLEEALRTIRARMRDLFGDIPLAMVDASVTMVYIRRGAAQSTVDRVHPDSVRLPDPPPVVRPYRYARGAVAVDCPSPDGMKTRAARLAEHVGGRWVHRAHGYVMSPRKAERLLGLFESGRDACAITGTLLP
jgi:hypothetical protein